MDLNWIKLAKISHFCLLIFMTFHSMNLLVEFFSFILDVSFDALASFRLDNLLWNGVLLLGQPSLASTLKFCKSRTGLFWKLNFFWRLTRFSNSKKLRQILCDLWNNEHIFWGKAIKYFCNNVLSNAKIFFFVPFCQKLKVVHCDCYVQFSRPNYFQTETLRVYF